MSIFHGLNRNKVSVQVRGFSCKLYVAGYFFTVRSC